MSLISDVKEELNSLEQNSKTLRQFAILMLIICSGFFAYFVYTGDPFWIYVFGFLLLVFCTGLFKPQLIGRLHHYWMVLAFVMGWFVSRLLLTLIYFIIVTPIGLVRRMFGRHFINIEFKSNEKSYWLKREQPKINYRKMS